MSRLQARMVNRLLNRVEKYLNETCTITRIDEVQGRLGMNKVEVIQLTVQQLLDLYGFSVPLP